MQAERCIQIHHLMLMKEKVKIELPNPWEVNLFVSVHGQQNRQEIMCIRSEDRLLIGVQRDQKHEGRNDLLMLHEADRARQKLHGLMPILKRDLL